MSTIEWVKENPVTTFAIFIWLVVNVMPRPHPNDHAGWKRILWTLLDRMSILTATALPGRLKMIGALSPHAGQEAPTATEAAPDGGEAATDERGNHGS